MAGEFWGADTAISMPLPPAEKVAVDFDGFGFTVNGVAHNITVSEAEELVTPIFAPSDYFPGVEKSFEPGGQ